MQKLRRDVKSIVLKFLTDQAIQLVQELLTKNRVLRPMKYIVCSYLFSIVNSLNLISLLNGLFFIYIYMFLLFLTMLKSYFHTKRK